MAIDDLSQFLRSHYQIFEWNHASAVLMGDFPEHFDDIQAVLTQFRLFKSHIIIGGGGKGPVARWLDGEFEARAWAEKRFEISVNIDGEGRDTPTHAVDFFKSGGKDGVAIEVEWNNKDPFFDRDLNNFRLLYSLGVISVGVIITRATSLHDIFKSLGPKIWAKYGTSTTHMDKLLPRADGGGAGGCPVIAFGITEELYDPCK